MFMFYAIYCSVCRFLRAYFFMILFVLLFVSGILFFKWDTGPKGNRASKDITNILASCDQETRDELLKLQDEYDIAALAATLKEREKIGGTSGLKRLAMEAEQSRLNLFDLQLSQIAATQMKSSLDSEIRKDFLYAHSLTLGCQRNISEKIQIQELTNYIQQNETKYLQTLQDAIKHPDTWRRVRKNPMMVFLMMHVSDSQLLDFYDHEQEWLDDVISVMLLSDVDSDVELEGVGKEVYLSASKTPITADFILQVAKANHPYLRDALNQVLRDEELDTYSAIATTFMLFNNYGKTLRLCIQESIPMDELLGVFLGNPDYFQNLKDSPEQLAARLIRMKKEKPEVWDYCQRYPYLINLERDLEPVLANSLCKKYAILDVGIFLYTFYSDPIELKHAAQSLDKFGDLAFNILYHYETNEKFHAMLKSNEIGVRIIPYMARFGDEGLAKLSQNKAWLDKYFNENGDPKEDEWWTTIPGGGAAKVAKNLAQGVPSTWGEVGWMVLDVADASLLVCTMGGSSGVSAAKSASTAIVRNGVKRSLKRSGGALVKDVQKRIKLFKKSIQNANAFWCIKTVTGELRVVVSVASTVIKTVGKSCYATASAAYRTWKNVPPQTRKMIYRALLVAGLTYQIAYRTIPGLAKHLPILAETLGRIPVQTAKVVAESVGGLLTGFLDELLGTVTRKEYDLRWVVSFILIISSLFCLVFWCRKQWKLQPFSSR